MHVLRAASTLGQVARGTRRGESGSTYLGSCQWFERIKTNLINTTTTTTNLCSDYPTMSMHQPNNDFQVEMDRIMSLLAPNGSFTLQNLKNERDSLSVRNLDLRMVLTLIQTGALRNVDEVAGERNWWANQYINLRSLIDEYEQQPEELAQLIKVTTLRIRELHCRIKMLVCVEEQRRLYRIAKAEARFARNESSDEDSVDPPPARELAEVLAEAHFARNESSDEDSVDPPRAIGDRGYETAIGDRGYETEDTSEAEIGETGETDVN